ncbi:MAG: fumarylacetoacetase [Planctomycetota bacterium]
MAYEIDETHDVNLESWVESANDPETDFPIQNLPLCTIILNEDEESIETSVGVAIGDFVLDLNHVRSTEIITDEEADEWSFFTVEDILVDESWSTIRRRLAALLSIENRSLQDHPERDDILIPRDKARLGHPLYTPNYTDFYASVHHATNVGSMFRPDNPLLPNYKWIPVGYHGRASSIVASGTEIRRPLGQRAPAEDGGAPTFGPCKLLDYELEIGAIVGRGNALGEPVSIDDAEDHILGLCLLNDWSARDLQKWEYQPLGPFLAKSFASTVSPYIVTMGALAPFRAQRAERAPDDPHPLDHLDSAHDRDRGAIDITVEAYLLTEDMSKRGLSPHRLSRGSFKDMYWTLGQMLAHHTSNGCNLHPGDLLGSGTISGPTRASRGCLLELTWDGDPWADPPIKAPGTHRTPIELPSGEKRLFLEDGDEVILKAWCEREGYRRIGFGECRGKVVSAPTP